MQKKEKQGKEPSNTKTLTFLLYICSMKRKNLEIGIFKALFHNVTYKGLIFAFDNFFRASIVRA